MKLGQGLLVAAPARRVSRLVEEGDRAWLACKVLDQLDIPIWIADPTGKIRYCNNAALAVLEAKDGLQVVRGRLESGGTEDNFRLYGFIRKAALCCRDGHRHDGGSIPISRPHGRSAWEVVVAPLVVTRQRKDWPPIDLVIVIANDPAAKQIPPTQHLQSRFGLTPAEARVALVIGDGGSLKQLAERLKVSVNTVRTHLQRVFEKTGTRRQADLARLISIHSARVLLAP